MDFQIKNKNIYNFHFSISEVKASSFTCVNKKTGLIKTIGVNKQPRKSKHAY